MVKCPNCGAITKQNKYGFTKSHSQRYRCQHCQKSYTPMKKPRGYAEAIRKQAIRMYIDGVNFRRIGRFLGVHHQTVINWINAYAEEVPAAPVPEEVDNVEMDELFTFIGSKKKQIYIILFVDRKTRCVLGWRVSYIRDGSVMQDILFETVQGNAYYSDLFSGYQTVLYWPAIHHPMPDKSETYSVEGDNAELRHYLARLGRSSRCFSRCEKALRKAIKIFVFAFNKRQLYKQRHPKYPGHIIDFTYTPI